MFEFMGTEDGSYVGAFSVVTSPFCINNLRSILGVICSSCDLCWRLEEQQCFASLHHSSITFLVLLSAFTLKHFNTHLNTPSGYSLHYSNIFSSLLSAFLRTQFSIPSTHRFHSSHFPYRYIIFPHYTSGSHQYPLGLFQYFFQHTQLPPSAPFQYPPSTSKHHSSTQASLIQQCVPVMTGAGRL